MIMAEKKALDEKKKASEETLKENEEMLLDDTAALPRLIDQKAAKGKKTIETINMQCLAAIKYVQSTSPDADHPWLGLSALDADIQAIFGSVPSGWTLLCNASIAYDPKENVEAAVSKMRGGMPATFDSENENHCELWHLLLEAAIHKGVPLAEWPKNASVQWMLFRTRGLRLSKVPTGGLETKEKLDNLGDDEKRLLLSDMKEILTQPNRNSGSLFPVLTKPRFNHSL